MNVLNDEAKLDNDFMTGTIKKEEYQLYIYITSGQLIGGQ